MSEVNREITLEVGTEEFTFSMTPMDVTKYYNATTPNNKIAPAHNLLMNTIKQEQKARLKPLLVNPIGAMQIASALLEDYSPDVEVIVKKPSTTPKD
ncbi:putative prophage PSSB64-01, Orf24 [Pseudomonas sp. StFLB209]|uniref:putative phage tail assembly chaperone n=1 Tax=Pseudomonas sp. StFLB209 TaxID=1028989 RepID=UPI0004F74884|nr:putative phage tail assembly chaperone [Pseudomonas sp. StFLB209]BAP43932.1 putative prophage PSSB64-01, Orf24 [Pseudomonas sp. StFLB209]